MAQRLKVLAVLGEDADSVPGTYIVFHNGLQLQFQGKNAFSGLPLAHIWCTKTCSHNTHIHKIKPEIYVPLLRCFQLPLPVFPEVQPT